MGLAGDGCRGERCLFGVELIKSYSHSNNTVPITRSACCGRMVAVLQ